MDIRLIQIPDGYRPDYKVMWKVKGDNVHFVEFVDRDRFSTLEDNNNNIEGLEILEYL